MQQFAITGCLIVLACCPVSAQIGPPSPRATSGGYSLGIGIQNVHSRWVPYDFEVSRNRGYVEGSFGFHDYLEGFARVGGSNWVVNDVDSFQRTWTRDVSSDGYPAFASAGVRGMLWSAGKWSIGGSIEVALYSSFERTIRWNFDAYQELFFESTVEVNTGLSIGYELCQGIVYAGPLLHFGYARADVRTHTFGTNWNIQDSIDALTVRDKGGVGGFVGWQTALGSCWHLQLEGAVLRDGLGGSIGFFKSW